MRTHASRLLQFGLMSPVRVAIFGDRQTEILQVCACLFGQALSHATSRPAMALSPGLRACKLASLLTADVLCCTHHHPATPPGTRCGIFRPHAGEGTTGRDRSDARVGLGISGPKAHASFQIASIDEIAILGNSLACKSRPSLVAYICQSLLYLRKREIAKISKTGSVGGDVKRT